MLIFLICIGTTEDIVFLKKHLYDIILFSHSQTILHDVTWRFTRDTINWFSDHVETHFITRVKQYLRILEVLYAGLVSKSLTSKHPLRTFIW